MINHTPPDTYVLRNMVDVAVPDAVSWWPTTVGWQLLAAVLLIAAAGRIGIAIVRWRRNRYRREALVQLSLCQSSQGYQAGDQFFTIIKQVACQLEPKAAKLFGTELLTWLEQQHPSLTFNDELGQRWLAGLLQRPERYPLDSVDLEQLQQRLQRWVREHEEATDANA